MASISFAELLLDIEKAAVEKQSHLLNKVKLMEAKQERDEPVRVCTQAVSYVELSILLALVKGLYNESYSYLVEVHHLARSTPC